MKKKLMTITTIVIIIALAAAGTAFAADVNGNQTGEPVEAAEGSRYGMSAEKGTGQRFALLAEDHETEEDYHAAVLAMKLEIIEAKVADGSLSPEDAEAITTHLTSCDGTCETEGENLNRPEEGWGIFGEGGQGSKGEGNGNRGNGMERAECDEDGEPLRDGSNKESGQGNRNGRNK